MIGSKAKHKEIRQYYTELKNDIAKLAKHGLTSDEVKPKVLAEGFFSKTVETPEQIAERLNKKIDVLYAKLEQLEGIKTEYRKIKRQAEKISKYFLQWEVEKLITNKQVERHKQQEIFKANQKIKDEQAKLERQVKELAKATEKEKLQQSFTKKALEKKQEREQKRQECKSTKRRFKL